MNHEYVWNPIMNYFMHHYFVGCSSFIFCVCSYFCFVFSMLGFCMDPVDVEVLYYHQFVTALKFALLFSILHGFTLNKISSMPV